LRKDADHQLEFIVTMHFLWKYLPKQGLVLDAGGGPGRYPKRIKQTFRKKQCDNMQKNKLDFVAVTLAKINYVMMLYIAAFLKKLFRSYVIILY